VQHGLRTIAFCHTRKLCELVIAYTRETLRSTAPGLEGAIAVYRAGYSPKVRSRRRRAGAPGGRSARSKTRMAANGRGMAAVGRGRAAADCGAAGRGASSERGRGAQERREVEGALFGGTLMGVAATNALELGIDVGSLDITLHLGFPGAPAACRLRDMPPAADTQLLDSFSVLASR
jgi:ATP-dependent helicase YprA (DUF1998 family)